jgi:hypothetical protein
VATYLQLFVGVKARTLLLEKHRHLVCVLPVALKHLLVQSHQPTESRDTPLRLDEDPMPHLAMNLLQPVLREDSFLLT